MAEQQWYYSHGAEELGPVSTSKIKQLLRQGDLSATDLIWKEGMDDWAPAGQVDGLLPRSGSGSTAAPSAPPAPPRAATDAGAPSIAAAYRQRAGSSFSRLRENPRIARQAMLFFGMVLVITARGCDGLGARGAQRVRAKYAAATTQFDDQWELRALVMRKQTDRLRDDRKQVQEDLAERRSSGETIGATELNAVNDQLEVLAKAIADQDKESENLADEKQEARKQLVDGYWRDLKIAARDADSNNAMWAYWRGVLFVAGSIILSIGLLLVGFNGQGAERWICLTMLAIIVFSLFVGGLPWVSGLNAIGN